jgi:hypothetical protein
MRDSDIGTIEERVEERERGGFLAYVIAVGNGNVNSAALLLLRHLLRSLSFSLSLFLSLFLSSEVN